MFPLRKKILFLVLLLLSFAAFAIAQDDLDDEDFDPAEIPVCLNSHAELLGIEIAGTSPEERCNAFDKACIFSQPILNLTTLASDPENDVLTYTYTVSAGTITGYGSKVKWDLSAAGYGMQTITICVEDGIGCLPETTRTFLVEIRMASGSKRGWQVEASTVDPNGFIISGKIGRTKRRTVIQNFRASLVSVSSDKSVVYACLSNCESPDTFVKLRVFATDPENDVIAYFYLVDAGKIFGQGSVVTWDLTGVMPGRYTVKVCADDGGGCEYEGSWKTLQIEVI